MLENRRTLHNFVYVSRTPHRKYTLTCNMQLYHVVYVFVNYEPLGLLVILFKECTSFPEGL